MNHKGGRNILTVLGCEGHTILVLFPFLSLPAILEWSCHCVICLVVEYLFKTSFTFSCSGMRMPVKSFNILNYIYYSLLMYNYCTRVVPCACWYSILELALPSFKLSTYTAPVSSTQNFFHYF